MNNFKSFLLLALIAMSGLYFIGCGSTNTKDEKKESTIIETWEADTTSSKVTWQREVDNKKIKQKVKMFGQWVNVNMENVQFSSEGEFDINKAVLVKENGRWDKGELILDLTTLKLYSQEHEKFFTKTEFPGSAFSIDSMKITEGDNASFLFGSMSILDSTKQLQVPATFNTDSLTRLQCSFTLQTLDWPIRENPDRENIRKDEIKINMDMYFRKTSTDTLVIK